MKRVLVERKVRQAEGLLAEATGRRKVRPGMFVQYRTHHIPDPETGQRNVMLQGRGKVEMVRPGAISPFYIREIKAWVLPGDVAILPRDRWPPGET